MCELVVTDKLSIASRYAKNLDRVPGAKGNPTHAPSYPLWPDDEVGMRTEDRSKHALERVGRTVHGLYGAAKRHPIPEESSVSRGRHELAYERLYDRVPRRNR
jgi:hypothetical protein